MKISEKVNILHHHEGMIWNLFQCFPVEYHSVSDMKDLMGMWIMSKIVRMAVSISQFHSPGKLQPGIPQVINHVVVIQREHDSYHLACFCPHHGTWHIQIAKRHQNPPQKEQRRDHKHQFLPTRQTVDVLRSKVCEFGCRISNGMVLISVTFPHPMPHPMPRSTWPVGTEK